MKKIILSLFVIIPFMSCKAQSKGTISVYGYKQAVLPGMIRGDIITEDGKTIEQPFKPSFNFFIYTGSNATIHPVEIWLQGKAYSVQTEKVSDTPVEYINPTMMPVGSSKTILVPRTSKKILKLALGQLLENASNSKMKSVSKDHELVVVYKQNGKTYYTALKKLKEIAPVAHQ